MLRVVVDESHEVCTSDNLIVIVVRRYRGNWWRKLVEWKEAGTDLGKRERSGIAIRFVYGSSGGISPRYECAS